MPSPFLCSPSPVSLNCRVRKTHNTVFLSVPPILTYRGPQTRLQCCIFPTKLLRGHLCLPSPALTDLHWSGDTQKHRLARCAARLCLTGLPRVHQAGTTPLLREKIPGCDPLFHSPKETGVVCKRRDTSARRAVSVSRCHHRGKRRWLAGGTKGPSCLWPRAASNRKAAVPEEKEQNKLCVYK